LQMMLHAAAYTSLCLQSKPHNTWVKPVVSRAALTTSGKLNNPESKSPWYSLPVDAPRSPMPLRAR
jgi:hypothetical protein